MLTVKGKPEDVVITSYCWQDSLTVVVRGREEAWVSVVQLKLDCQQGLHAAVSKH